MKTGSEDRKKMILAGSLGAVALGAVIYTFAGSGDAASAPAPVAATVTVARATPSPVAAKVSRTATDPTLHPEGMELTEQLLYTGSGRNIFSASSEPVKTLTIPKPIETARQPVYVAPVNAGPTQVPIDLRFFGTATRANGSRQAFFLKGDEVFLAQEGEVVSRRYKVGPIAANSVEVTDLVNNNQQRLPLATQ